jgi:hypothetical protein
VALAAIAALVLLTGTGRAIATAGAPSQETADPVPTSAPRTTTAPRTTPRATKPPAKAPTTLAGLLPVLEAYVEQERGLRFTAPVKVEVLSDKAFDKALKAGDPSTPAEQAQDKKDYEGSLATLLSLGLVRDRAEVDDYVDSDESLASILGFYDPETKRLVVRGTTPTPFVQQTIVHELVHAIDDQHFDLDRPELESDSEAELAFAALVEGNASRIDELWYDDQSRAVRRQIDADGEDLFGGSDSGPEVLSIVSGYPYFAGPGLIERLLEEGGQARLDAAFRRPPTTSEQVLDPDLAARAPVAVPPHPAGSRVLESDVLGELGLAILLQESPLEPEAALGWAGDRYVTYATADATCTVVVVRTGSASQQRDLLEAAADVVDTATPLGATGVRLEGCKAT